MDIKSILFLDVETIPEYKNLDEAPSRVSEAWFNKFKKNEAWKEKYGAGPGVNEAYIDNAALFPEYGKICCISIGVFHEVNEGGNSIVKFKLKSFYGKNEREILEKFKAVVDNNAMSRYQLCAHNGKGFDFPYMANRYIVNKLAVPMKLQVWDKKPWELTQFVDTMELWKFGKFKGTSLDDLCLALGIESPKIDMDGSNVSEVYWKGQWKRLADYCEGDVLATARCLQRMHLWTPIEDSRVDSETKFTTSD